MTTQTDQSLSRHDESRLAGDVAVELRAVARRLKRYVLLKGMAGVAVFLLAAAVVQFALDRGTHGLQWSMRAALLTAIVLATAALLWRRLIAPLRHRVATAEIANLVERQRPELHSILVSAVRFTAGDVGPARSNSPELVASVVRRAAREAQHVDFAAVLDRRSARTAGWRLGAVLALGAAACVLAPQQTRLWFVRNVLLGSEEWPKRTHLFVDMDGDTHTLIGARGDDLVIQAYARGEPPREVDIIYETVSGQRGRETMTTVGSREAARYRYTARKAREDFSFYLVGGDDRTEEYHARLLDRPRVTKTEMRIQPPAYTNLDPVILGNDQRSARILPGSNVTIRFETNKPVTKATLMAGREKIADAMATNTGHVATCAPIESHTYHFSLLDEVGLENRRPVRFSLRVVPDEPPRVRLKVVGVGDMITPHAVLPIEVDVSDAYGLATVELIFSIARDTEREGTIPLPTFLSSMKALKTEVAWPVAEESVTPGETVALRLRATDHNLVTGPGESETPEVILRVVTRDELLAELARREQEYRSDFERLIEAQERVRGGLLTVARRTGEESAAATIPAELTPLERRQRNIVGSVNIVRQQFEQILTELHVNQLDTLDERVRLGDGVVVPLNRLAKRDLAAAADAIRQWARAVSVADSSVGAAQIDTQQSAILAKMREILANMIQWEGYQEVVNMLRDILRLQQELRTETRETLEEQGSDVFDN